MKKLLKRTFYFILSLVVILIIAGVLATQLINPNQYKDKITTLVQEKTGRELIIKGDLKLSFFPWLGVQVYDIQLSNAAGFQPAEFATLSKADVHVKLLPLLSKQIEVGKILLKDLNLNLAKNKQGVTNWADLAALSTSSKSPETKNSSAVPAAKSAQNSMLLSIAGVNIENAQISWVNAQNLQTVLLKNVEISSTPTFDRAFPFHASMTVNSAKPDVVGHLTIDSDVLINSAKTQLQFNQFHLIFAPQHSTDKIALRAEKITANIPKQTLVLSNGVISQGDLTARLNMQAKNILENPAFEGQLESDKLTLAQTEVTRLFAKFTFANSVLQVNPLLADVYKGGTNGTITADFRGDIPTFKIEETFKNIDIAQLIKSGRIVGKANLIANITAQGKDKASLLHTLNGDLQFNVQKGALVGTNIPFQVERAIALLKRQPVPKTANENETVFDELRGTGTLNNGVLHNNDLLMQSSEFKGTGGGTLDLVHQTIDYSLRLVGLHMVTDAQGNSVQEERQTVIPVLIAGTFDHPTVTPDMKAILQNELQKKAVDKVREKLQNQLGPDTGKAVDGLLKSILQ